MDKKYKHIIVLFLIVTCFVAFGRIVGNDFVNFDDDSFITENKYIKAGFNAESIKWALTASSPDFWHPLTWLSIMLDWNLFGANPSGHHLVSLLWHIGSVILLFLFFKKTTGTLLSSVFVAALFALHPLRVESVAWAAERKDVLSVFFVLAALYAYAFYIEKRQISKYIICIVLFALSLMAKPTFVTLPFVLMLLDYWPLARWQKASTPQSVSALVDKDACMCDKKLKAEYPENKKIAQPAQIDRKLIHNLLWEKLPFIFLSASITIMVAWQTKAEGLLMSFQQFPFFKRVINAIISYVAYLGKTFWPVDLAVFYPYEYTFSLWSVLVSFFILIGITIFVIYAFKKTPFLFVGWFWFLGTLIPVIGLVQAGSQSMADRYTYLPSIGIAIMLVWGIPFLFPRTDKRKNILFPAGIAILLIMAVLTWQQCGYWKNGIELYSHALRITKNNVLAHNNRGVTYDKLGQYQLAIQDYNAVIRLKPDYVEAYNSRGCAYSALGQYQLAIQDYNVAIRMKPDYAEAYNNRGVVYDKLGQHQLAMNDYDSAIRLKPDYADAYNNRGVVYSKLSQYQLAIKDYNTAIRLKPECAEAYYYRGCAYSGLGQHPHAMNDYNAAIRLKPGYAEVYNVRGVVYSGLGQYQLAIQDYNAAIRLKPDYAIVYLKRGGAYDNLRQEQRAIQDYSEAIRLKPDYADAYNNRGIDYLSQGNKKLGCSDAQKACALGNCKLLKMAKGKGDCL